MRIRPKAARVPRRNERHVESTMTEMDRPASVGTDLLPLDRKRTQPAWLRRHDRRSCPVPEERSNVRVPGFVAEPVRVKFSRDDKNASISSGLDEGARHLKRV